MAVTISKSSQLNDDLWNEWATLIRSFVADADKGEIEYDNILKSMFNVSKSDRFGEKNTGLTEFGDFSITGEGGSAVLDDMQEGFAKLIEHEELMKKMVITKTMVEDTKATDMLKQKAKNFVKAYKRSRAQYATNALVTEGTTFSFGGQTTLDKTTGDGKALFAIDHPGKKAGVPVQSNVYTAAFSLDNLIKLANIGRNFLNESGNVIGYEFDTIMIPGNVPALEEQIKRIIRSELVVGSSNNDVNTQAGKWKLIVNPLWVVTDADYAPYILMSSSANEELMGNVFFDRTGLEVKEHIDPDTFNLQYTGRFRMGAGFFNWRQVLLSGAKIGSTLA